MFHFASGLKWLPRPHWWACDGWYPHSPPMVNHPMVRFMKGGESLSVLRPLEGKRTVKVQACWPTDNIEFVQIQRHVVRTSWTHYWKLENISRVSATYFFFVKLKIKCMIVYLCTLLILVIFLSGVKEKTCILFYRRNAKFLRALYFMNFARAEIPSKIMVFRENCQVNISFPFPPVISFILLSLYLYIYHFC